MTLIRWWEFIKLLHWLRENANCFNSVKSWTRFCDPMKKNNWWWRHPEEAGNESAQRFVQYSVELLGFRLFQVRYMENDGMEYFSGYIVYTLFEISTLLFCLFWCRAAVRPLVLFYFVPTLLLFTLTFSSRQLFLCFFVLFHYIFIAVPLLLCWGQNSWMSSKFPNPAPGIDFVLMGECL